MNTNEAIQKIKRVKGLYAYESDYEALDMAIAALEFRERYDNFWEEVKAAGMKGKETEIHHGGRVFRIREVAQ